MATKDKDTNRETLASTEEAVASGQGGDAIDPVKELRAERERALRDGDQARADELQAQIDGPAK